MPEAVYMPGFTQFPDRVDYYSVLAHESGIGLRTRPGVTGSLESGLVTMPTVRC